MIGLQAPQMSQAQVEKLKLDKEVNHISFNLENNAKWDTFRNKRLLTIEKYIKQKKRQMIIKQLVSQILLIKALLNLSIAYHNAHEQRLNKLYQ